MLVTYLNLSFVALFTEGLKIQVNFFCITHILRTSKDIFSKYKTSQVFTYIPLVVFCVKITSQNICPLKTTKHFESACTTVLA